MNATTLKRRKKIFLGFVCAAVCIMIFLVGLWPFSFRPQNEVGWLPDRNGISLGGLGIVYSNDSLDLSRLLQDDSISIEVWLEPGNNAGRRGDRRHYAYILSLYDTERDSEVFVIGQWRSFLNLRSRFTDQNNYKQIGLDKVLAMGGAPFITITSGANKTSIFVDGRLARVYPGFSLGAGGGEVSGKLTLGNSATGEDPWSGKILYLAIYNRVLPAQEVLRRYQQWPPDVSSTLDGPFILYMFDERDGSVVHNRAGEQFALQIPAALRVFKRPLLVAPWLDFRPSRAYLEDVIINVIGFVPLGFFLAAFLYASTRLSKYRLYFITLLLGGGVSLTIELTQVYLITRNSSLTDLILNITGTVVGLMLFRRGSRFFCSIR